MNQRSTDLPYGSSGLNNGTKGASSASLNARTIAIIAHIDHGKTTLLDRLIQVAAKYKNREILTKERIADRLELEQEKGITIKMQPVTLLWKATPIYVVDTPGHVDFAYEVSRSLNVVEGAILLIDVTQGIQAQTVENLLLAIEHDLEIIPVLNKIDLADKSLINQRLEEIKSILGYSPDEVLRTSGKTGEGVEQLLNRIIEQIPPARTTTRDLTLIDTQDKTAGASEDPSYPIAAVLDAFYDNYDGVVLTVKLYNSTVKEGDKLWVVDNQLEFVVREVGEFAPSLHKLEILKPGAIGYIKTGIKDPSAVYTGATVAQVGISKMFPGYRRPQPKVFASFYPREGESYMHLKDALNRLRLNDFSLHIEDESSALLGKGFKIGFLGLLHLEITKERLKREYGVNVIVTQPIVPYKYQLTNGKGITIKSIIDVPEPQQVKQILEPFINAEVITPSEYFSAVLDMLKASRSIIEEQTPLTRGVGGIEYYKITAKLPYSEVVDNLFNRLKAVSRGYASISYGDIEYLPSEAVKVQILINHEPREELSFVTHPQKAESKARTILGILKKTIPPTIVPIPLQAAIGGRIIARETIRAMRKNVTAKLYGGDVRRKLKLLRNQAKLKKLRSQFIKVKIPDEFFKRVLSDTGGG